MPKIVHLGATRAPHFGDDVNAIPMTMQIQIQTRCRMRCRNKLNKHSICVAEGKFWARSRLHHAIVCVLLVEGGTTVAEIGLDSASGRGNNGRLVEERAEKTGKQNYYNGSAKVNTTKEIDGKQLFAARARTSVRILSIWTRIRTSIIVIITDEVLKQTKEDSFQIVVMLWG